MDQRRRQPPRSAKQQSFFESKAYSLLHMYPQRRFHVDSTILPQVSFNLHPDDVETMRTLLRYLHTLMQGSEMAALLLNEPPELAERKDPVLVAQSPQAAISLLRQLAPKNTLPMEMWQRLIDVFGQNEGVNGCGLEKPEEEGVSAEADLGHGTGVAMDDSYQTLNDGDDCRRQLNNYHPFEPCLGPRFTDAQNTDHIESTSKRRAGTEKSIAPKRKSRSTKKELQMIRLLKARCQAQGEQLARTFKRKEHPSGPSGVGRKAKRTKPSPCVPACDKSFDTEFDDAERPFAKAIMQTEGSRRKQRKLNTAKVKDIIVKVQALANDDVLRQCRDIVSYWRRSGSLVSAPALPANENGERRKRSEAVTAIKELRQWYHVVYDMSENSTVADLTYRIWHAELGREYEKLRVRYSSTHASKRLFWQLHPELIAGHDMSHVAPSIRYPDPWKSFEKRLRKSRRWYQIACKLGWSIFFLFARNAIPHSWVEECAKDELDAWTVAIQTCRPEIWLGSYHLLDYWGVCSAIQILRGASPPRTLSIERILLPMGDISDKERLRVLFPIGVKLKSFKSVRRISAMVRLPDAIIPRVEKKGCMSAITANMQHSYGVGKAV